MNGCNALLTTLKVVFLNSDYPVVDFRAKYIDLAGHISDAPGEGCSKRETFDLGFLNLRSGFLFILSGLL